MKNLQKTNMKNQSKTKVKNTVNLMKQLDTVGGQAVIEGVMMRAGNTLAVACRKPDGRIVVNKTNIKPLNTQNNLFSLPIVRGFIMMIDMMKHGWKALEWSAKQQLSAKENSAEEKEKFDKNFTISIWISGIFATILALALFILLPFWIAQLFFNSANVWFNITEGIIRGVIFFAYLGAISLMSDMKRIYQYHGAEHKTVWCYESGKSLTAKNVKTFPKEHPRCGTSFLIQTLILAIIIFTAVRSAEWYINLLLRIVLLPAIIGISYEAIKLQAKILKRNPKSQIARLLSAPGIWTQHITTKEPNTKQILVAIKSLREAIR